MTPLWSTANRQAPAPITSSPRHATGSEPANVATVSAAPANTITMATHAGAAAPLSRRRIDPPV
jgi:hypothetical protein